MNGNGIVRCAGTKIFSATIVLLPVAAIPLACQSSSRFNSRLGTITHVGMPAPLSVGTTAFRTVQVLPWPPVLYPHRPLTTSPPDFGDPVPVGEKTPLIRGSPLPKISSCASSGNTPASQEMALKIVATQDVDGQPRAISASTSHWVWKSVA